MQSVHSVFLRLRVSGRKHAARLPRAAALVGWPGDRASPQVLCLRPAGELLADNADALVAAVWARIRVAGPAPCSVVLDLSATPSLHDEVAAALHLLGGEHAGHALIGARQWIPAAQIAGPVRSLCMGLPLDLQFRTKGQLAIELAAGALADGITFDFFCGDEVYGSCTQLREFFEDRSQAYVLRVPSSFRLTLPGGKRLACAQAARALSARKHPEVRSAGKGSKGQRPAGLRWPGEEDFAFGKDRFGLDQSQVRLYTAIARHTVLVMAALAICALTAAALRRRTDTQAAPPARPDQPPLADPGLIPLTVPETARLLTAALERPMPPGHATHWQAWRTTRPAPHSARRSIRPRSADLLRDVASRALASGIGAARQVAQLLRNLTLALPRSRL